MNATEINERRREAEVLAGRPLCDKVYPVTEIARLLNDAHDGQIAAFNRKIEDRIIRRMGAN